MVDRRSWTRRDLGGLILGGAAGLGVKAGRAGAQDGGQAGAGLLRSTDFGIVADGGATDQAARINAMLAASANQRMQGGSQREVVFSGGGTVATGPLTVPHSNIRIIFDGDLQLVPFSVAAGGIQWSGRDVDTYLSLAADAAAGGTSVRVADAAGLAAGQWCRIASERPLPDVPNDAGKTCGQIVRIAAVEGGTVHFDSALFYDYAVADGAKLGAFASFLENITIEGFRWGSMDAKRGGRGISLAFAAHVRIDGARLEHTRDMDGKESSGRDGIILGDVVDAVINEPVMTQIGWYGVAVDRACRDITLKGGTFVGARHAVSVGANGTYGEPVDLGFFGVVSRESTLSAFDTHEVGRRITFDSCVSEGHGDNGGQVRTSFVTHRNCRYVGGRKAVSDGVKIATNAGRSLRGTVIERLVATGNGRFGINNGAMDTVISDAECVGNGLGGIATNGGRITGGRVEENGKGSGIGIQYPATPVHPAGPLLVSGVALARDGRRQAMALRGLAATGFGQVTVEDCDLSGNYQYWASVPGTEAVAPPALRRITWTRGAPRSGTMTLVAGKANVATKAVRAVKAASGGGGAISPLQSQVHLIPAGGTLRGTLSVVVIDQASFTVTSTDPTDTATLAWSVE
ncbi:hypothetical protein [Zavarzinia sp. CC-PAN008]|uniref:hypothetical protein n=1 Tax=Zavarzinia sp. CC-PAN008 TaxID=3243332 RepID=UPI003F742189